MKRPVRGFTLLELLVVMVIIGLLASYVAPRFFDQIGKSEVKAARAQLDALDEAVDAAKEALTAASEALAAEINSQKRITDERKQKTSDVDAQLVSLAAQKQAGVAREVETAAALNAAASAMDLPLKDVLQS